MNLKNKNIAEGMRVTNGKQVWKVIYWNDKYTDALLQKIDRNGNTTNDYVIAENYELYGDISNPQISWMNGMYFDAINSDEAYDIFIGWLVGDKKKFNESKRTIKESIDRDTWKNWKIEYVHHIEYFFNGRIVDAKTLQSLFDSEGFDTDVETVEKEIEKDVRSYKLGNLDGTAIHIAHNRAGTRIDLVFNIGELMGEVQSLSYANNTCVVEFNGDIYEADEMWNFGYKIYVTCSYVTPMDFALAESKKRVKPITESAEGKEYFVGNETAKGFEVCMIENGKKYYLSKLAKNLEDSSWSSDHTYAKHWKDKSKAEEVVNRFNSELTESKTLTESTNDDYWVFAVYPLDKGYLVNTNIKDYQYMEIKDGEIVNHSNSRESWFANKKKKAGYKDNDDYTDEKLVDRYEKTIRKIIDGLGILTESKVLTESAKPINEKTVAKFVDEINQWCDDNIHYINADQARFTKEYGKLYDFKYGLDYTFGDKGEYIIWDEMEELNIHDDSRLTEFIRKLAKKNGWYPEAFHSNADFALGIL